MQKMLAVAVLVVVVACGQVASAYLRTEDGERPSPYEQAMLKRLQTFFDSDERQRVGDAGDLPSKRQMRYNQCYFNPISCFKRRK